jgi:hypothetical protein
MKRRITHDGVTWQAWTTGTGHGVGSGHLPSITKWAIVFRKESGASSAELSDSVRTSDIEALSTEEITAALGRAIGCARKKK